MKQRQPLRKLSEKKKALLSAGAIGLRYNSTIMLSTPQKSSQRVRRVFCVKRQTQRQTQRLSKLAAIRKQWWKESKGLLDCGICGCPVIRFSDLASDHIEPGNFKSDEPSNLQPSHKICNILKGSQRNFKIVRGDHNWELIHGLL